MTMPPLSHHGQIVGGALDGAEATLISAEDCLVMLIVQLVAGRPVVAIRSQLPACRLAELLREAADYYDGGSCHG